jgi:hypothetical protein
MGVIGEIEARLGIGCAPGRVDLEGTDLPVGGDRPHQKEEPYECREEEKETTTPAAALFLRRSGREIRQAHPRSTLAPSDYNLCFAPALSSASRYGTVTIS